MNIFNILIAILAVIILYIILKKYNSKKNEKFTTTCSTGTASLTDWEKLDTEPTSGRKLTNSRWNSLKTRLSESDKDIVSFSFKDDLFKDMNDVEYYKIDINDYLEINKVDGSTEYWKPIKKWKDGVVSHFCKELCILKLGYEWIKVNDIIHLSELSTDIGTEKTNSIRELIKINTNNEYAKLDETVLNDILGSYYINDNNYIVVDGINYKVATNIPIGRKWKVYSEDSYISSEKDVILTDLSNPIVSHFNNLVSSNIGDIIILSETEYIELFDSINLTEKYVIHPTSVNKCFMPELFEYDTCYYKSCAIFANKEFDDYSKLINLRQSSGYKTTSFKHTIDIMDTSDNKLLNLVNQLQQTVDNKRMRGDCSYSLLIDKLIENIRVGDYVKNDDSIDENCPKTYDPHTYIIKPTLNIPSTYESICNDLDVKEYRTRINPEIYKYITEEWIQSNPSYTLEDTWDNIKDDIDLSRKDYNNSLNNKIISKNQLSELIAKYLDDVEYSLHENYRKPLCFDGTCNGSGIIIQNPNTKELMDSKNNKLNENNFIDLYSDEDIYHWQEVDQASNPKTIPSSNLGIKLSDGTREFTITEWDNFSITTPTRYDIFEYNGKYYQYMGLLRRYIKMGKVSTGNYVEITADNIDQVNITPDSNYITKSECDEQVIDMINSNNTNRLDRITDLTDTYYQSLLTAEREHINTLKTQILDFNNDINTQYDLLCEKYNNQNDYKLYSNYNIIKFTINNSLDTSNKINLSNLAQKTIKLKEIISSEINNKFNKSTEELEYDCRSNECRNIGNITDQNIIDILDENTVGNIITISLNDFSRLIDKVNILENDYIRVDTTRYYKILSIYDDNIVEKIDSDFSIESYPDVFNYTYNDFISINIDLHRIDINADYYIMVNDKMYDLNIDDLFERFISNYKSVYEEISNINLTNHEKCLNNQDELLFANEDAIVKGVNSCTTPDHSCKEEGGFTNQYTQDAYESMGLITVENKQSWNDNNFLTDYNDTYKSAIGYDITESLQDNTHANYWKNRYHNEEICPPSGTGKPEMVGDLYYVNPEYNYGLKWKKLQDGIDISSKTIIEIYDYDVIDSLLDSTLDIIDLTSLQNNIRFKNSQGIIINMSQITTDYYLMIKYVNPDESEFINYYEVFGTNKCSDSQICSTKSNRTYMGEFNTHVENIYNDRENCSTLNNDYADRYVPAEQTSFDKANLDFESLSYNPNTYDSSFTLYIKNEQASNDEE